MSIIALNRLGSGLSLDGVDAYVDVPDLVGLAWQHNSTFCIASVVVPRYKSTSNNQVIASRSFDASTGSGWLMWIYNLTATTARIEFNLMRNKTSFRTRVVTVNDIPFNIPVSIMLVKASSAITDYYILVDGLSVPVNIVNTMDATTFSYTSAHKHLIGAQVVGSPETSKDNFLKSPLHGLAYLNRAPTPVEVNKMMAAKLRILPDSLSGNTIAFYDFNKKQGTELVDRFNSANNGTIMNAVTTPGATNQWVDKNQQAHLAA